MVSAVDDSSAAGSHGSVSSLTGAAVTAGSVLLFSFLSPCPISRSNKFCFVCFFFKFVCLFLAVLGLLLHGLFSAYGEQGLLFDRDAWTSRCSGFCCCGAQTVGHAGCGSCSIVAVP